MERFVVVVECIIEHQEKYLIITRPQDVQAGGLLAFPGGKVDVEDGAQDADILINAVKREVLEEVGLDLKAPIEFVTSGFFLGLNDEPVLALVFYVKLNDAQVDVKPSAREVPEYAWMTTNEIAVHSKSPVWVKRYLKAAQNHVCRGMNR